MLEFHANYPFSLLFLLLAFLPPINFHHKKTQGNLKILCVQFTFRRHFAENKDNTEKE